MQQQLCRTTATVSLSLASKAMATSNCPVTANNDHHDAIHRGHIVHVCPVRYIYISIPGEEKDLLPVVTGYTGGNE